MPKENQLSIVRANRKAHMDSKVQVGVRESDHDKIREIAFRARLTHQEVLHLFIEFAYARTRIVGEEACGSADTE